VRDPTSPATHIYPHCIATSLFTGPALRLMPHQFSPNSFGASEYRKVVLKTFDCEGAGPAVLSVPTRMDIRTLYDGDVFNSSPRNPLSLFQTALHQSSLQFRKRFRLVIRNLRDRKSTLTIQTTKTRSRERSHPSSLV
jgi:hypothetical protein